MGIPELMKYVARGAPDALQHLLPGKKIPFDMVFVDVTNSIQSIGIEALSALLLRQIEVRRLIVFVMDGPRSRAGSQREQRNFLAQREVDLAVQKLAADLAASYTGAIKVLIAGREIFGEGDFKLLDLHRRFCLANIAESVLFVSEDADLLCGGICGPASSRITIATRLQDTIKELCMLRVEEVIRFLTRQLLSTIEAKRMRQQGHEVQEGTEFTREGAVGSAAFQHQVAIDFVFTFLLIMGNGSTLPRLAKGATRVDAVSTWSAYCQERASLVLSKRPGDPLAEGLILANDANGCMTLNCELLTKILETIHCGDASSARVPGHEERRVAKDFLRLAALTCQRFVLGACLDSREEAGIPVSPTVAALTHTLSTTSWREFDDLPPFSFSLFKLVQVGGVPTKREVTSLPSLTAAGEIAISTPNAAKGKAEQKEQLKALPKALKGRLPFAPVATKTIQSADNAMGPPTPIPSCPPELDSFAKVVDHWRKVSESSAVKTLKKGKDSGVGHVFSFEMRRMLPIVSSGTEDPPKDAPEKEQEVVKQEEKEKVDDEVKNKKMSKKKKNAGQKRPRDEAEPSPPPPKKPVVEEGVLDFTYVQQPKPAPESKNDDGKKKSKKKRLGPKERKAQWEQKKKEDSSAKAAIDA